MDYTPKEIKRIIERYQELRSLAEVVSSSLDDEKSGEFSRCLGFGDIVCMLVDVDRSIPLLTPRQREVVTMLKEGCSTKAISNKLSISLSTIKIHTEASVRRITAYLNASEK
jgi:DNA-binding NarL/FixJ family response regulator